MQREEGAAGYRPSILILARHFPPLVSGGARRPYLLSLALAELGCDVRVVAPALPEGVRGLAVPHPYPEPSDATPDRAKRGARDLARDLLLWPDPDIRWAMRAARAVKAGEFRPDWVLTTSPPESLHAAGAWLKRRMGCRWAADLRDEWLMRPFRSARRHPARRAVERAMAEHLLRNADLITAVDEIVADEATALSGQRAHVLRQFAAPPPPPMPFEGEGPHLVYTGSFSLSDPNCRIQPTLAAFSEAFVRRPELRLHLIGRLTAEERQAVEENPARAGILLYGPRPYEETRARQAAADGFIVAGAPDATAIPGKVFEYRTVGAPIIAVGDGPWRRTGGYDEVDPVLAMIDLTRRRNPAIAMPASGTPRQAAQQLLALMSKVERNKLS